jgi:hypothetical protein
VRLLARLLLALASAGLPVALALASCSTDAGNVDGCRLIEYARCDLAPACSPGFDVDGCKRFYRDECLVGTGNADASDTNAPQACIDALKACAAADASDEGGCPGLAENARCTGGSDAGDLPLSSCNIVMHCPEALAACAWVVATPIVADAGSDAADATDDADDAADASDSGS